MVKKTRGKQRGIQQFSVRKHKVRLRADIADLSLEKTDFEAKLANLAGETWSYLQKVCSAFILLPFQVDPDDGRLVLCSVTRRVIHYALMTLFVALVVRHLVQSIWYLSVDGFDLNSTLGLCFLMYYIAAVSGAIGSSLRPREMIDLLNSWHPQIDYIEGESGNSVSLFGRTSENIKVIWTTAIFHIIPMEFAVGSVLLADVPATMYGFVRSVGFDPESSGSTVALIVRILVAPLDLMGALGPGWIGTYNISAGTLGLGLFRIYCGEMRKMSVKDLDSWRKVERTYVCFRVYNVLFMNWIYYILAPLITGISAGIVLLLYISARPSGLPPFIYYWIPFLGFGTLCILSWLWYDVVTMKREGEDVLDTLQTRSHPFLWKLELNQRKYVYRKSRALRPPYLTIGQFSDMTLEGLVGVWDEILNQFLFLLSL